MSDYELREEIRKVDYQHAQNVLRKEPYAKQLEQAVKDMAEELAYFSTWGKSTGDRVSSKRVLDLHKSLIDSLTEN